MGCDIHAHVEIKVNNVWHHWSNPRIRADYALFTRMAGVREVEGIEPIDKPRGLPEDITFQTRYEAETRWALEGHSHSWLSCEGVAELIEWKDALDRVRNDRDILENPGLYRSNYVSFEHTQIGYIYGNGWNFKKYPEDNPRGLEDARLVFWFDN